MIYDRIYTVQKLCNDWLKSPSKEYQGAANHSLQRLVSGLPWLLDLLHQLIKMKDFVIKTFHLCLPATAAHTAGHLLERRLQSLKPGQSLEICYVLDCFVVVVVVFVCVFVCFSWTCSPAQYIRWPRYQINIKRNQCFKYCLIKKTTSLSSLDFYCTVKSVCMFNSDIMEYFKLFPGWL